MKRFTGILRNRGQDKAVAEIIGTILVFAIVVSVFTAFVAWYVPTTGAANEQSYQDSALGAFSDLAAKLSSEGVQNGSVIVQSFPLGIAGVPPFQPSYPTQVSSDSSGSAFNFSLRFNVSLNYTENGNHQNTSNISVNLTGRGYLQEFGQTNFISPESFIIQDGNMIESYGLPSQSSSNGPMPVFISNNSGQPALRTSAISVAGSPVTISQVGSAVVSMAVSNYSSFSYSVGHDYLIGGNISLINSISITDYNYFIETPYYSQWNYSLYTSLNNSTSLFNPHPAGTSWNDGNFSVKIGNNSVYLSEVKGSLESIQFQSYVIRIIGT
ncbi:hypothetical protein Thermo_01919 [Thermoplasmatales archaeon]|nr:hypothetical protein Thermo_01919 [Thermoplasmatales archaeon]